MNSPDIEYLRFETTEPHPESGLEAGIFYSAYRLQESSELAEYEQAELADALRCVQGHLPIPTKFSRTQNTSYRNKHGLSWVKASAAEAVSDLYRLAEVLSRHGLVVNVQRTTRPGYVVYEDEWQVVAELFFGERV